MNDELIKQVFFYCENRDPNGCYADEVDVLEFGRKLTEVMRPIISREEHERCVGIVRDLNREVGAALAAQRPD